MNDAEPSSEPMGDDRAVVGVVSWAWSLEIGDLEIVWRLQERRCLDQLREISFPMQRASEARWPETEADHSTPSTDEV